MNDKLYFKAVSVYDNRLYSAVRAIRKPTAVRQGPIIVEYIPGKISQPSIGRVMVFGVLGHAVDLAWLWLKELRMQVWACHVDDPIKIRTVLSIDDLNAVNSRKFWRLFKNYLNIHKYSPSYFEMQDILSDDYNRSRSMGRITRRGFMINSSPAPDNAFAVKSCILLKPVIELERKTDSGIMCYNHITGETRPVTHPSDLDAYRTQQKIIAELEG